MSKEPEQNTQSNLPQSTSAFIERLAEKIGVTANAKTIYADPVERDGITIIPVAKVRYGFGGGSGVGSKNGDSGIGFGGGGGVQVSPVGYIEMKEGSAEFRRITKPPTTLLALAGGLLGLLLLRGLLNPRR